MPITGPTSATPFPGAVNSSALLPDANRPLNYPSWVKGVVDVFSNNVLAGAGAPVSWDYDKYGNPFVYAHKPGMPGPSVQRITEWVLSGDWKNSPDDTEWVIANFGQPPAPKPDDYIQDPAITAADEASEAARLAREVSAEQWNKDHNLNLRQQDFTEAKFMIDAALSQSSGSRGSGPSGPRSSGSMQSASDQADRFHEDEMAMERARLALQEKLGMGQLDLGKLQLEADTAYKAEQVRLEEARLAQQDRQFQQEQQLKMLELGNEKAKITADVMANPNDQVQAEYWLRGMAEPTGTAVNIFTGEQTDQNINLSTLMEKQKGLANPLGNNAVTPPPLTPTSGLPPALPPPPAAGGPLPPVEPPPPALPPPPAPVPALAGGSDGWLTLPEGKMITGDHPGDQPNPELVEVPPGTPVRVTPRPDVAQQQDMRTMSALPPVASSVNNSRGRAPQFPRQGFRGMLPGRSAPQPANRWPDRYPCVRRGHMVRHGRSRW